MPAVRALQGETVTGERTVDERVQGTDGRVLQTSVSAAPMRDPSGHITGAVVVVRDVTTRRALERQVVKQERLFRTLVENSPDIIARFDRDLRYLYVSHRLEAATGLTAQALLGKTDAELGPHALGISAERYDTWVRALTKAVVSGERQALEFDYSGTDGATYFLARIIPEQAEDGSVETVLTVTTDVTELKRTEQALREAQAATEAARQQEERRRQEAERREEIAESLRDVLAILNSQRPLDEILRTINQQAGQLLGSTATAIYGPDSGIGQSPGVAEPPERVVETLTLQAAAGLNGTLEHQSRLPFAHAAVCSALATRAPVAVQDLCVAPAEGANGSHAREDAVLPVLAEALPSPYQALLIVPIIVHDETYGCLLLFYTIQCRFADEEVALAIAYADQAALAIGNARLQEHIARDATAAERNRLARELHDTVTQEIFSASLLAETIPKALERRPAEAEQALKQLNTLTRGALAALRLLLLELRPAALEQMPLPDLLRQLSQAMATRAGVPIAVHVEGCEGEKPPLPTDVKFALYRMAQEMLMNSVKYASAHAITVQLHLRRTGSILLEVDDDGQGFDPGAVPAGHFGLTMMRERAQAIGATVYVRSQVGLGTRVVVVWRSGQKAAATHQEGVSA